MKSTKILPILVNKKKVQKICFQSSFLAIVWMKEKEYIFNIFPFVGFFLLKFYVVCFNPIWSDPSQKHSLTILLFILHISRVDC